MNADEARIVADQLRQVADMIEAGKASEIEYEMGIEDETVFDPEHGCFGRSIRRPIAHAVRLLAIFPLPAKEQACPPN